MYIDVRREELDHLKRFFTGAGTLRPAYHLSGISQIGKTSLAKQAIRELAGELQSPIISVSLNWADSSQRLFDLAFGMLVQRMSALDLALPEEFADLERGDSPSSFDSFERFRKALGAIALEHPSIRVILLLDDLDQLVHWPHADAGRPLRWLRSLLDDYDEYRLACLFLSRRRLRCIEKQIQDVSNIASKCDLRKLTPLSPEQTEAFVRKRKVELSPLQTEQLHSLTGGHIGWLDSVIEHIVDSSRGIEHQLYEYYEDLRRLFEEDEMFDTLLQLAVGPFWVRSPTAKAHLQQMGVLLPLEGKLDGFVGWSPHFQFYLQRCARAGSIWETWLSTERLFQELIDEGCSLLFDTREWHPLLLDSNPKLQSIYDAAIERQKAEKAVYKVHIRNHWIEYCFFRELWKIAYSDPCWEPLFRDLLGGESKEKWNRKSHKLNQIRNSEAHGRKIPEELVPSSLDYCNDFKDTVLQAKEKLLNLSLGGAA